LIVCSNQPSRRRKYPCIQPAIFIVFTVSLIVLIGWIIVFIRTVSPREAGKSTKSTDKFHASFARSAKKIALEAGIVCLAQSVGVGEKERESILILSLAKPANLQLAYTIGMIIYKCKYIVKYI
jgi:hypothetical protein